MSSFSCPHLNEKDNYCLRLKTECVPGRKGCVLRNRFQFIVPAEERITEQQKGKTNKKLEYNEEDDDDYLNK